MIFRSHLARANQRRSWHICEDLALRLIARARPLYWVAVAVYVLVAIVRKELGIKLSPYRMMQTMSVMPFEQVSLHEWFTESWLPPAPDPTGTQMLLFET